MRLADIFQSSFPIALIMDMKTSYVNFTDTFEMFFLSICILKNSFLGNADLNAGMSFYLLETIKRFARTNILSVVSV